MTFLYAEYLIPLLILIMLIFIVTLSIEKKFYAWVELHWFYKRSKANRISSYAFLLGLSLIILALMDLRGPEKNILGKVSEQKTVILIDNSSSMMAEDIRPNRLQKSIVLAKHFIRKAVGHSIAVAVFSDTQKKIIPFTNDIDLVDARLSALKDLKLDRGGTSLTLAINEAIQYFRSETGYLSGNLLVITDAEETSGEVELNVPNEITVAVIGVGTIKGSPIPMRNNNNVSLGNKRYNGEVVITKLDEDFLRKMQGKIKNYKYWISGSYTLPSEQIVDYFNGTHQIKESQNNYRIRPVLQNTLLIPGMILLIISFLLRSFRSFILNSFMVIFLITFPSYSKEVEKEKKEKSREIKELESKFRMGDITNNEKRSLAQMLLKEGHHEDAQKLYHDLLNGEINEDNKLDYFNYGASQFKSQNIAGGFETYKNLYEYLENNQSNSELLEQTKQNLLKAIEQAQANQKNKEKKEKDKEKKENREQGESGESGNDKKDEENKQEDGNEQKPAEEDNETQKNEKNKNDSKEKKPSQELDKNKTPAILKQLVNDDNKLQKQVIDSSTDKRKERDKKDW